jgi:putative oxidoreductase
VVTGIARRERRMDRWLGKYGELIYAVMRLVVGLLFACHGAQKLFGVLGGTSRLGSPMMLTAGLIEFAGGLLVALGLWASWAAFIASGEMAVAYFRAHAAGGFWPILNRGELAVLYCFVFLFIASRGSGSWSVDAVVGNKKTA